MRKYYIELYAYINITHKQLLTKKITYITYIQKINIFSKVILKRYK